MLENTIEPYYKNYNLSNVKVLLVQENLDNVVTLTELLIDAGVDDTKIYNASSYFALEHYLDTAKFSHIIIDAKLYNYSISSLIHKYYDEDVKILVNNFRTDNKTIRLISDKNINYLPSCIDAFKLNSLLSARKIKNTQNLFVNTQH